MGQSRSSFSFERFWFLDCFGHVLCYAPHKKDFLRLPLQGLLVSGFLVTPYPFPEKAVLKWCNILGDTLPVYPLQIQFLDDLRVALYRLDRSMYLSIEPSSNKTVLSSVRNEWETFCCLTEDAFAGFLVLTDPELGKVISEKDGRMTKGLHFLSPARNKFFTANMGGVRINVLKNLETIAAIGRLKKGESASFLFKGGVGDRDYNFSVEHL